MDPNDTNRPDGNPSQGNESPIGGQDSGLEERRGHSNPDRERADDRGRRTDNQSEEAIPELDDLDADADTEGSSDHPRRAGTDNKAGG